MPLFHLHLLFQDLCTVESFLLSDASHLTFIWAEWIVLDSWPKKIFSSFPSTLLLTCGLQTQCEHLFGEDEVDSVSCTWCLSCHGDTVVEHRLVSFTRALTCDSACLANYSPCYPFPWHTHFVPHSNSSGRSSDSVPLSRSLPSFLYFWHQTFWARRPQHNVNYSAWLARGWEQIINRRWSQAISYGWLWLNTNAQNHFQTHTNIRFHYL